MALDALAARQRVPCPDLVMRTESDLHTTRRDVSSSKPRRGRHPSTNLC